MRKIKVLHLISRMNDGGAQRIVLNYLRDLKDDKQIEIKLFVYGKKNNSYCNNIMEKEKLPVVYLNSENTKINIPYLRKFFNRRIANKAWKKAIEEFHPDIIHVHISSLLFDSLNAICDCNIPIRFNTLHSHPLRYHGIELKTIRKAYKKERFIPICVTHEQVEIAKKHYGFNKYEVIHNGVDLEKIKNLIISKEEARKIYNIPSNRFVILAVGRLDKIKKFDFLIDIFYNVIKKNRNSLLVIAGEGKEKSNLIKKVKDLNIENKVIFVGNQDNIIPVYCASDVLAVTSKSESASLVLLEAQVCNLRCVISAGVPSESIITNKVKKMENNASLDEWCEALLDVDYIGEKVEDISNYEVHSLSKKMKDIYLKYWEEYNNGEKK